MKIQKSERELSLTDDAQTARMNWNKYRAYAEPPGTYFFADKNGARMRVKIVTAELTKDARFVPLRVVPEGKREMDYADFAR